MWYLPEDYVPVHKRIEKYHEEHKENMSIDTKFEINGNIVNFKATVVTKKWTFTWSSFWTANKEKAFEKLETVAVWRALAFAWYEVKDWIASKEEMQNFQDNKWYSNEPKQWLNYEDFVNIVEAWNTTEEQIANVIKEDWYSLSKNAKNAVRHYVETWELEKNLFFSK